MNLLDLIKKYNPDTFPVSNFHIDFLDDEPQDNKVLPSDVVNMLAEKGAREPEKITNISADNISFDRNTSYLSYFLDGCRRAYYICDMATTGGSMLPIIIGQISAGVLLRQRSTGTVHVHKYVRKGLFLLPVGGCGIPEEEAGEFKKIFDRSFASDNLSVQFVTIRHNDNPKNDSLAKLNMEMQNLEIKFLEEMTDNNDIGQDEMVVVDGALQFQNVKRDKVHNLRYAVGLAKHFNLHLTNLIGKTREIGTLLIRLNEVGERTPAYRLRLGGVQFAFWYLRIRPHKYLNFPFAGIVKLEKVLVTEEEVEDGLTSNCIDNISRCVLKEISVCSHGNDFRWASHIYPIYLTEQLQKKRFMHDYFFKNILRRRLAL